MYKNPSFSFFLCISKLNKEYLSKSINSILIQTFNDFDLLICVNGDENVYEEIKLFLENNFPNEKKIKLFHHCLKSLPNALNYLLNQTNADYILRMDDDDICLSNRL